MPTVDRSGWRNTFIYASNNRTTVLGGLWAAENTTNTNLYSMLQIFCSFSDTFNLHSESGRLVERGLQPLQPGNYYIVTNGSITITEEAPLTRTTSLPSGTRVTSFRDAVRDRDRRCIVTGLPAVLAEFGNWRETMVLGLRSPASELDGSINSVQNGILLQCDLRLFFDSYDLSINPDDNYKIVCFTPDSVNYRIDKRLDQSFIDNPLRPVDELLRWHFRQAVLVNMKGAGEPCFEIDFPPGSDIMGEIMAGPKCADRMEFELFTRFNAMTFCA
ncbi:hypothetical protein HOY82DRAFT_553364 [Tuber indicum]|nr:hypothetical protein HOY82DRAFT_553364 [Tuber indicum]